jgi:hypothetical protein
MQGAHMITRRIFQFGIFSFCTGPLATNLRAQGDETIVVRVRADETVQAVIPPIGQKDLTIEPDQSDEAKDLSKRSPPGRAAPVILIIVGAIAIAELLQMIKEMLRQFYYGGVFIDVRFKPPRVMNDPKIPANMVFVIDSSGKTSQYTTDQFSLETLNSVLKLK